MVDSLMLVEADPFDVLLTHDSPVGMAIPEAGSPLIDELLESRAPVIHFFGHYHRSYGPEARIGATVSRGLAINIPSRLGGPPQIGSLVLLRWSGREEWSLEDLEPSVTWSHKARALVSR